MNDKMNPIFKLIKEEKNKDKQRMFQSVYFNNLGYSTNKKLFNDLKKIIRAMQVIDRKFFVLKEDKEKCYVDMPLSIGYNQSISQPTTVARMLSLSQFSREMDVLEIGTGSGWNAALTAYLVYPGSVITAERIKPLQKQAKKNFDKLNYKLKKKLKIDFIFSDALDKKSKIWIKKYDRIVATAGINYNLIEKIKDMGKKLLKESGLLLYPTRENESYGAIELWQKKKEKLQRIYREIGYSFVPLLRGK